MSDLKPDAELVRETAKEPAKRWRNWWRLYPPAWAMCDTCFAMHNTPSIAVFDYNGCCEVWPSKDIAESRADRVEYTEGCEPHMVEYLGAFPEGERP